MLNIETISRKFLWWHIPLIILIVLCALAIWVLTWDFEPVTKPTFLPHPAIVVTNNAYIGYTIQPFEVTIKGGDVILLKMKRNEPIYIKARGTTTVEMKVTLGKVSDIPQAKLSRYRIQSEITATKWGLHKTVLIDKQLTLAELITGTLEVLKDVMPLLP